MAANVVGGVKTQFHPNPNFATFTSQRLRQDLLLMDLDFINRDRAGNLMLLEIKARQADIKPHQKSTLSIINLALNRLHGTRIELPVNNRIIPTILKYHGCHLLQWEKDEGDVSGKIWLDYQEIEEADLIRILNFELLITRWKQSRKAEAVTDGNYS